MRGKTLDESISELIVFFFAGREFHFLNYILLGLNKIPQFFNFQGKDLQPLLRLLPILPLPFQLRLFKFRLLEVEL